jgi:hypothetical protein
MSGYLTGMNTLGWILFAAALLVLIVLGQVAAALLDRTRARRVTRDLPERINQPHDDINHHDA